MELHLVRHGKTMANEQRLYCGQTDLTLSPDGAAEITLLKSQGVYPPIPDLLFSSGLLRTEQTINIIYGSVFRKALPDLAEYHFGEFEMHSYEELKGRDEYQFWITDETGTVPCPCGESKKQFEKRVVAGYHHVVSEVLLAGCSSAFVVCHGGTIACLMEYLQPNTKGFYEWQPAPGRGYTLDYANGQLQELHNL